MTVLERAHASEPNQIQYRVEKPPELAVNSVVERS